MDPSPEPLQDLFRRPDWPLLLPANPDEGCVRLVFRWDHSAVYLPLRSQESLVHKPGRSVHQTIHLSEVLQSELRYLPISRGHTSNWSHLDTFGLPKRISPTEDARNEPDDAPRVLVHWSGSNSVLTVYQRTLLRGLSICATWLPMSLLNRLDQRMPQPAPGFPVAEFTDILQNARQNLPLDQLILRPLPEALPRWRWNTKLVAASLRELTLNNSDLAPEALDGLTHFLMGNATLQSLNLSANADLFRDVDKVARFSRAIGYSTLQQLKLNTMQLAGRLQSLESFLLNLHSRTLSALHLCNMGFEDQRDPVSLPTVWTEHIQGMCAVNLPLLNQACREDVSQWVRDYLTTPGAYVAALLAAFIRRSITISAEQAIALQRSLTYDPHVPPSECTKRSEEPATDLSQPTFAPFSPSGGMIPPGCPNLMTLALDGQKLPPRALHLVSAALQQSSEAYLGGSGTYSTNIFPRSKMYAKIFADVDDGEPALCPENTPNSAVQTTEFFLCATILTRAYEPFFAQETEQRGSSQATSRIVPPPALWDRRVELLHEAASFFAAEHHRRLQSHEPFDRTPSYVHSAFCRTSMHEAAALLLGKARVLGCQVRCSNPSEFSLWLCLQPHIRTRILRMLDLPGDCTSGALLPHSLTRIQFRSVLSFATDRRTIGYTASREALLVDARLQHDEISGAIDEGDPILNQPRFSFAQAYLLHGPPHHDFGPRTLTHDQALTSFLHITGTAV